MREIKFRAWHKKFFILIPYSEMTGEKSQYGTRSLLSDFLQNPDYEVMQYTGLKDKNGKEIYEGDIVEVLNSADDENGEFDVTTVCKWDNGCFVLEDCAGGHWTRQLFHAPERLTIKGNIYENASILTV
jgi:uncharacterized phage protein (TIGR01671 family)